MPCNTVTLVSLEMKNVSMDTMLEVLKELGLRPIRVGEHFIRFTNGGLFNHENGELCIRNLDLGQQVKQTYTKNVIAQQAKRFGWNVKQVQGQENKLYLERR